MTEPHSSLQLPGHNGLTMMIDSGSLLPSQLDEALAFRRPLISFVKLAYGTSYANQPETEEKAEILHSHRQSFYFGGTLFEAFVRQGQFYAYLDYCRHYRCSHVEISDGTIEIPLEDRYGYIEESRRAGFRVITEVGHKSDQRNQEEMADPRVCARQVRDDLAHGADLVILEARESGRCGIATADGRVRRDIAACLKGVALDQVMFEAPTKDLQLEFIDLFGSSVNLGNISPGDIVPLETLRQGLRGDTMLQLLPEASTPSAIHSLAARR